MKNYLYPLLILLLLSTQLKSQKTISFNLKKTQQNPNSLIHYSRNLNENQQEIDSENNSTQQLPPHPKQSLKINLRNILGIHYDAIAYIGPNKQEFKLIMDTGSTTMWIADQQCTECKNMGITNKYNCLDSETCQFNKSFKTGLQIEYGHGSVYGKVISEQVTLSLDSDSPSFEMPMLLVNQISDLNRISSDGIIGLGRKGDSEFKDSFIDVLKQQNIIERGLFSLYLTGQKCVGNSILTVGGYDTSLINGEINYLDTVRDDLWAIAITEATISFNKKVQKKLSFEAKSAVIDSGTTKITFSSKDLLTIIHFLKTQDIECKIILNKFGLQDLVCSSSIKEKDVHLILQAQNVQFKLVFKELIDICYVGIDSLKGYVCRLAIQVVDIENDPIIILGEVFMQKYITIFDEENDKIGFGIIEENLRKSRQVQFYELYENIYLVFFQAGIICAIAIIIALLSHCYYKFIQQKDINLLHHETDQSSRAHNESSPSGITIDMSGNGIESFDEGDSTHHEEIVSEQNYQDNQLKGMDS